MFFRPTLLLAFLWVLPAAGAQKFHLAVFGPQLPLAEMAIDSGRGLTLGILPVTLAKFVEEQPCDSCGFLSTEGVEFYLDNALADFCRSRLPAAKISVLRPIDELAEGTGLDAAAVGARLVFPLEAWFDGYQEDLVLRPKDRFSPPTLRDTLSALGGKFGCSHLLTMTRVEVDVAPAGAGLTKGKLGWAWHLVCWNVARGMPDWVIACRGEGKGDLDHLFQKEFTQGLEKTLDKLPGLIAREQKREPR